jgi:hypothetical protein
MNILLFEKKQIRQNKNITLAFRKIATLHKSIGDVVLYTNQISRGNLLQFKERKVDIIYFTTIFTYHLNQIIEEVKQARRIFGEKTIIKIGGIASTLMPEYVWKSTGIEPYKGLWEEVENLTPDYSDVFPRTDNATCFTTRGCIRNCGFCAVRRLEPSFHISKNWKEQILAVKQANIKNLHIQDNNFLASPWDHQKEVVNFISKDVNNSLKIDFNQALDCRLFKTKHALLLSKINIPRLRFSFDSINEAEAFKSACERIVKTTKKKSIAILVFLFYGFNDKPEDLFNRFEVIKQLQKKHPQIEPHLYLMRYQPLDCLEKNNFIGKYWSKKEHKNLKRIQNMISFKGTIFFREEFKNNHKKGHIFRIENFIGSSPEEFKEILNKDKLIFDGNFRFVNYKKITSFINQPIKGETK